MRQLVSAIVVAACLVPAETHAQYFGQNKVQYERFDYQVLQTEHFDIYHYPEEADAVRLAARLAERWRSRLGDVLGFALPGRQPLVLYASHPHFTQTQVIGGLIGEGTGGVTESLKRRMVLPFGSSLADTSHVLGHEMVHAFQYAVGGERTGVLPLWFVEGMAEYLSLGPDDAPTAAWLRDLAAREAIPGLDDLDDPRYFPYRVGHAVWAFLASRFGSQIVGETFLLGARSGDALGAIAQTTGQPIDELSAAWRSAVAEQHAPPAGAAIPGRRLLGSDGSRGRLNVAPSLSHDGRWIAYLSERDLFSIDVYIAETATGRVVRRLTTTDTDPHIESLQFVQSAGAWDRTSRRFAFTSVTDGQAALAIVDAEAGWTRRTIALSAVDEAWHPTWSPDGRTLAFAGLAGGVSDLYALDLDTGATRRLTNDAFADLQPAWSPDGRTLAFVTDRFTSSLQALTMGDLQVATIAVGESAGARPVAIRNAIGINPQWDRDGVHLYFVGEPDGVPNVYRIAVDGTNVVRVTDVGTGVSGITGSSPAISYAAGADRLAFSVLRDGGYDIHVVDSPKPGPEAGAGDRGSRSVMFPDPGRSSEDSLDLPGSADVDVPDVDVSAPAPYRPTLSLDVAGAAGGVGVSGRYGATFGGGIGMQFSDMLGEHELGAYLSANGGVRDLGGQLLYMNRRSRWNWGAAAMLLPYVSGSLIRSIESTADNRTIVRDTEALFRQTDVELRGIVAYPFSRAFRAEFQGGARRLFFGREANTRIYDFISGDLIADDRTDLQAPAALTFAEGSAALVYDQAVFGPASPLTGQRYRFEVAPTAGSIRFTGVTLDVRRYFAPVRPLTLAFRAMHLGRYGTGGEDPRLSELFLGYSALVRGYDPGTFDSVRDCDVATGACPEFDALFGSRLLIGNAELRFPLFGVFSGEYRYGPLPIEGFLFGDAGVAWTSTASPTFAGGERDVVRSVGAGVRVNAFGYAVIELAASRPLDRARRGWVFGFNLRPGF